MGPRSFRIQISGQKIWSAPTKTDLPYNFCLIKNFPSLTVAAVDVFQTLFRAPLTPGVHPGGGIIAYDLALVKLGPHTKFGEDWSKGVDFYSGHTHTHTDSTLYIRYTHKYKHAYTDICVCACVYVLHTHRYTHIQHTQKPQAHLNTWTHTYIHSCTY